MCKKWRHKLLNIEDVHYHGHVWKNYPYIKPEAAWCFDVFWKTALKHKAVRDGSLHLVRRISLLGPELEKYSKHLFWYHRGFVCFYQPWEVNKVVLYDLKNMKPGEPVLETYFSADSGDYIVSANVGGTQKNGTYLVYCVYQPLPKQTQ